MTQRIEGQPAKWNYQHQVSGKTYSAFWNGKTYGTKVYVTTDQGKVTLDTATGRVEAAGSGTIGNANDALAKAAKHGIAPFASFAFSNRESITADKK